MSMGLIACYYYAHDFEYMQSKSIELNEMSGFRALWAAVFSHWDDSITLIEANAGEASERRARERIDFPCMWRKSVGHGHCYALIGIGFCCDYAKLVIRGNILTQCHLALFGKFVERPSLPFYEPAWRECGTHTIHKCYNRKHKYLLVGHCHLYFIFIL